MSLIITPSNEPPIHSRKLLDMWRELTNINGRLRGLVCSIVSSGVHISAGSYIANGNVIVAEECDIPIPANITDPYYVCGKYEIGSPPELLIAKYIKPGYAPIAYIEAGLLTTIDSVTPASLKYQSELHSATALKHITIDNHDALVASSNPGEFNLFLTNMDLNNGPVIKSGELSVLPKAMDSFSFRSITPDIDPLKIKAETVVSMECGAIVNGVNGMAESSTLSFCPLGAYFNRWGASLIRTDISSMGFGRLDASTTTDVPAPYRNESIMIDGLIGEGDASITWVIQAPVTLSKKSICVMMMSDKGNGCDIELEAIVSDGTLVERSKFILNPGAWSPVIVNTNGLNSLSSLIIKIKDFPSLSSSKLYVSDIFEPGTIKVSSMEDVTGVTSIRTDLSFLGNKGSAETYAFTVDDATSTLIKQGSNNDIASIISPGVKAFGVLVDMHPPGGNYSQLATPWPSKSINYFMLSDNKAAAIFRLSGIDEAGSISEGVAYNRPADSMQSVQINTSMVPLLAKAAKIKSEYVVCGGMQGQVTSTLSFKVSLPGMYTSVLTSLPSPKAKHGFCGYLKNKAIAWMGEASSDVYEYNMVSESWTAMQSSTMQGATDGGLSLGKIYASYGNGEGVVFDPSSLTWSLAGLSGFKNDSTVSATASGNMTSRSVDGGSIYNVESGTEISANIPAGNGENGGNAVYFDDIISYGPYEVNGVYNMNHTIFTPNKPSFFQGLCMKWS